MSVSVKHELVIKDACVLFDLIDLELLQAFYQLPQSVVTTQAVILEVTDPAQRAAIDFYISTGNLAIDQFGLFETITGIIAKNAGLSFTDGSVIEVALRRQGIILSSDKSLRNESTRRGLTVRGMLWIIEELYRKEIITLNVMIEKLGQYPQINRRAPLSEIKQLLAKYNH